MGQTNLGVDLEITGHKFQKYLHFFEFPFPEPGKSFEFQRSKTAKSTSVREPFLATQLTRISAQGDCGSDVPY